MIADRLLSNVKSFREANMIFAMYTIDLAMGHTLLCMSIKSETIKIYIKVAADHISESRRRALTGLPNESFQWIDPRLDITTGKLSKRITSITDEVRRWEKIANRREPVTTRMITYGALKCDPLKPFCIDNVMYDWTVIGIYTGVRLTEWAQPKSGFVKLKTDEPKAFMWQDVEFRGVNNRRMTISEGLENPSLVHTVRLTWREQKNGQNGEKKTIVRSPANKTLCAVSAVIRVMERFQALGLDKKEYPLAVFTSNGLVTGKMRFVRAPHIEVYLQRAAKNVYNITNKEELQRFSAHSIRVGACVALHAAGVSKLDIKHALRWKSDGFMVYLRDLPCQAQRNANAVLNFSPDCLDIIPHAAEAA